MQIIKKIAIGFLIGILSGLLGVGGGIFLVPLMVGFLGYEQHRVQATSLAMIIPTAICGSYVYSLHGNTDLHVAFLMTCGSVIGAYFGARLMTRLPAEQLKALFALLLIFVGLRMVIS